MRTPLEQSVLQAIQRAGMLAPGDRVGVAVSGGADSVALLRLLARLRDDLGITLAVVHFNHSLRAAESDGDAEFVAQLAQTHGLEFITRPRRRCRGSPAAGPQSGRHGAPVALRVFRARRRRRARDAYRRCPYRRRSSRNGSRARHSRHGPHRSRRHLSRRRRSRAAAAGNSPRATKGISCAPSASHGARIQPTATPAARAPESANNSCRCSRAIFRQPSRTISMNSRDSHAKKNPSGTRWSKIAFKR